MLWSRLSGISDKVLHMDFIARPSRFTSKQPASPIGFRSLNPAQPTVVYDTYWRLAAERQAIFFKRLHQEPAPWTDDSILQQHKFTNAYRASDRVSQYLIRNVIYDGEQNGPELVFRTLLFKIFNRIETWELLVSRLGSICYKTYRFRDYDTILTEAMESKSRIYSAAYIMPSGGALCVDGRKHRMHLRLLEQMMQDGLPARLEHAQSLREAFEILRSYPTLGDFLAYQYVIDLNYSSLMGFSENDFVMPGPGALDGIRKCFSSLGGLTEAQIIRVVAERQQAEFERLGLNFQSLWGRDLHLIDCQNLFCEVDKYARVHHPEFSGRTGRTRIKQAFNPTSAPICPWYPPKWGINEAADPQK